MNKRQLIASTRQQPLAEVFGFPATSTTAEAMRYRTSRFCPFNNGVPNCTKDKIEDPLGVCSINYDGAPVITCPVRFRQDWIVSQHAADFFFPPGTVWTSLPEVGLDDASGKSAGNIDLVLVAFDDQGRIIDFGALEVQAVYISGNVRHHFRAYQSDISGYLAEGWQRLRNPHPDYLSSSRKRLAPQLLFKGRILHTWKKRQAVAIQQSFYKTLPPLTHVDVADAELVWLIYDLALDDDGTHYHLILIDRIYTLFDPALIAITTPNVGSVDAFLASLPGRLDALRRGRTSPDAPTLSRLMSQG